MRIGHFILKLKGKKDLEHPVNNLYVNCHWSPHYISTIDTIFASISDTIGCVQWQFEGRC
jgi:hypothetical protein